MARLMQARTWHCCCCCCWTVADCAGRSAPGASGTGDSTRAWTSVRRPPSRSCWSRRRKSQNWKRNAMPVGGGLLLLLDGEAAFGEGPVSTFSSTVLPFLLILFYLLPHFQMQLTRRPRKRAEGVRKKRRHHWCCCCHRHPEPLELFAGTVLQSQPRPGEAFSLSRPHFQGDDEALNC